MVVNVGLTSFKIINTIHKKKSVYHLVMMRCIVFHIKEVKHIKEVIHLYGEEQRANV